MSKRLLFRIHGAGAETKAEDCKAFIRGYFDLWRQRVRLSVECANLADVDVQPYDLFVHTSKDEQERIAHAAGWSYLQAFQIARPMYDAAMTTFHNNSKLVKALQDVKIHF